MYLHALAVFPDAALVLPCRELLENLVEEWDVSCELGICAIVVWIECCFGCGKCGVVGRVKKGEAGEGVVGKGNGIWLGG